MTDGVAVSVSDDLDALRRSLDPDHPSSPALARFLAACSGTLRAAAAERAGSDDPAGVRG